MPSAVSDGPTEARQHDQTTTRNARAACERDDAWGYLRAALNQGTPEEPGTFKRLMRELIDEFDAGCTDACMHSRLGRLDPTRCVARPTSPE